MRRIISLSFVLLMFSLLIPRVVMGGVLVGVEDIISIVFAGYVLLKSKSDMFYSAIKPVIPLAIFLVVFIPYGVLQSYSYLGEITVPTEIWQYLKRMVVFSAASIFFVSASEKSIKNAASLFIGALVCYQVIGLLQIVGGGVGVLLSDIYARTDHQFNAALHDVNKRVFGVSGFSTSWGGFSVFTLLVATYFILAKARFGYSTGQVAVLFFLLVSSVLNIVYSGSRGALLSGVISIVYLYFAYTVKNPKKILVSTWIAVVFLLVLYVVLKYVVSSDYLDFIAYRFDALMYSGGGGRTNQALMGVGLLDSYYEYLMGMSNRVQRVYGISHGIEVEPVHIFVNYGFVGAVLIYGVYAYFFFCCKSGASNKLELLFIRTGFFFYLVFSMGYFFYAELVVGVLPWLFFGYLYALFMRSRLSTR